MYDCAALSCAKSANRDKSHQVSTEYNNTPVQHSKIIPLITLLTLAQLTLFKSLHVRLHTKCLRKRVENVLEIRAYIKGR